MASSSHCKGDLKDAIKKVTMASSSHYKGDHKDAIKKVGNKFIVQPKALDIVWGRDPRYWRLPTTTSDSAELLQVSWLEVNGSLDMDKLEGGREYMISFRVKMKPDAFGWSGSPVYLMAKPGNRYYWKNSDLSTKKPGEIAEIPREPDLKFRVSDSVAQGDKLLFGMYEIWRGRWKGGLVIQDVVIEPVA